MPEFKTFDQLSGFRSFSPYKYQYNGDIYFNPVYVYQGFNPLDYQYLYEVIHAQSDQVNQEQYQDNDLLKLANSTNQNQRQSFFLSLDKLDFKKPVNLSNNLDDDVDQLSNRSSSTSPPPPPPPPPRNNLLQVAKSQSPMNLSGDDDCFASNRSSSTSPPPPPPPRNHLLLVADCELPMNLSDHDDQLSHRSFSDSPRDLPIHKNYHSPAVQEVNITYTNNLRNNDDSEDDDIDYVSSKYSNQGQAVEELQEMIENNQQIQQNSEKEMPATSCLNYCFIKLKKILKNKQSSRTSQGFTGINNQVTADLFFVD